MADNGWSLLRNGLRFARSARLAFNQKAVVYLGGSVPQQTVLCTALHGTVTVHQIFEGGITM